MTASVVFKLQKTRTEALNATIVILEPKRCWGANKLIRWGQPSDAFYGRDAGLLFADTTFECVFFKVFINVDFDFKDNLVPWMLQMISIVFGSCFDAC